MIEEIHLNLSSAEALELVTLLYTRGYKHGNPQGEASQGSLLEYVTNPGSDFYICVLPRLRRVEGQGYARGTPTMELQEFLRCLTPNAD